MRKLLIIILLLIFWKTVSYAAAWYDTGDPATANGSQGQGATSFVWVDHSSLLVLPAGTVSKLRAYTAKSTFAQGIKIALYTTGGSLIVGGTSTQTTGTNLWQEISVTPTVISAGTYYMALLSQDNASDLTWATLTASSGTSYVSFSSTYAAMPTSTIPSNGGNEPYQFFDGAFVTPASGAVIKTINGVALASVKTVNGVAIASVKTYMGAAAQ